MIPGLKKPLRHCTISELYRHAELQTVRRSQGARKYSVGLLEEAYSLSLKLGATKAAQVSGVKLKSLLAFITVRRKMEGTIGLPRSSLKITEQQKEECYRLAIMFKRAGERSIRKCWIRAGQIVGCNGRSVEFQYVRGLWTPKSELQNP